MTGDESPDKHLCRLQRCDGSRRRDVVALAGRAFAFVSPFGRVHDDVGVIAAYTASRTDVGLGVRVMVSLHVLHLLFTSGPW